MESCEVIAIEEEAAIGFSGKVIRKGLPPRPGIATRIVEGGKACGAASIAGVNLAGAGFPGLSRFESTTWGRCETLGSAGCRTGNPAGPLLTELASALTAGLVSVGGDKFAIVDGTFAFDSEFAALSICFSSGGVAGLSWFAIEDLSGARSVIADGEV